MTDIKSAESCDDSDATVKCGNKIINLRQKLKIMANTIIKKQERNTMRENLSNKVTNKIKERTQVRSKRWAIADAGATGHFVMHGAPVINVKPTASPIKITLPDGQFILSTHTCNLNIPWLPSFMTEAHIVPGMAHSSLISIKKFCDGGCKVMYDMTEVRVMYKGKVVLSGGRDKSTGLWLLPIAEKDSEQQERNTAHAALDLQLPRSHTAANTHHTASVSVYTLPYKQQQMKYMHQSFYNMPIPTSIKAIQNNNS
jgi:hypothetical protein